MELLLFRHTAAADPSLVFPEHLPGLWGTEHKTSTLPLERDETCLSCILVDALAQGDEQL